MSRPSLADCLKLLAPPVLYLLYISLIKLSGIPVLLPLGMGGCAVFLLWRYGRKRTKALPPFSRVAILPLLAVCLALTGAVFGAEPHTAEIGELFCVCAAAPVCEEIIYRGYVRSGCKKYFGTAFAVFFSTLLFALAHGEPMQICYAAIGGVLFCAIVERTGSVFCSIFVHSAVNILSYCKVIFEIGLYPALFGSVFILIYIIYCSCTVFQYK